LGFIKDNIRYKLVITWINNSYLFELINDSSNIVSTAVVGDVSKLTSNKGSICIGGWWKTVKNEEFAGLIDLVEFNTPALHQKEILNLNQLQQPSITKPLAI
jgi:hypothetical protein